MNESSQAQAEMAGALGALHAEVLRICNGIANRQDAAPVLCTGIQLAEDIKSMAVQAGLLRKSQFDRIRIDYDAFASAAAKIL